MEVSDGVLYSTSQSIDTGNLSIYKSVDAGLTWTPQDVAGEPTFVVDTTLVSVYTGRYIISIHTDQVIGSSFVSKYDTQSDTFIAFVQSEPPTQVYAEQSVCAVYDVANDIIQLGVAKYPEGFPGIMTVDVDALTFGPLNLLTFTDDYTHYDICGFGFDGTSYYATSSGLSSVGDANRLYYCVLPSFATVIIATVPTVFDLISAGVFPCSGGDNTILDVALAYFDLDANFAVSVFSAGYSDLVFTESKYPTLASVDSLRLTRSLGIGYLAVMFSDTTFMMSSAAAKVFGALFLIGNGAPTTLQGFTSTITGWAITLLGSLYFWNGSGGPPPFTPGTSIGIITPQYPIVLPNLAIWCNRGKPSRCHTFECCGTVMLRTKEITHNARNSGY